MLRAAIFEDFKNSNLLLIWGDNLGIKNLQNDMINLKHEISSFVDIQEYLMGGSFFIRITQGNHISVVEKSKTGIILSLSLDKISNFIELIDPLTEATAGHQYLEASGGLVDEIMISVNEYPENI